MLRNIININRDNILQNINSESLTIPYIKKKSKYSSKKKNITYPIIRHIDPTFNTNNDIIVFCIYYINRGSSPYISYLLNKIDNNYYLPQIKLNDDLTTETENFLKELNLTKYLFTGNINKNNKSYLFYELDNINDLDLYSDNIQYLFATMYEILLTKTILYYNIDNSVTMFFDNYHVLQTLYYDDNTIVPISCVSYYVSNTESPYFNMHINNIIIVSNINDKYGPFVITSDFESTIDYSKKETDKNSLVIFRKNVFADKIKIVILSLNESYNDKKCEWRKDYDTLYVNNPKQRLLPGLSTNVLNLNLHNLVNI